MGREERFEDVQFLTTLELCLVESVWTSSEKACDLSNLPGRAAGMLSATHGSYDCQERELSADSLTGFARDTSARSRWTPQQCLSQHHTGRRKLERLDRHASLCHLILQIKPAKCEILTTSLKGLLDASYTFRPKKKGFW
jgi:hypothetical protein